MSPHILSETQQYLNHCFFDENLMNIYGDLENINAADLEGFVNLDKDTSELENVSNLAMLKTPESFNYRASRTPNLPPGPPQFSQTQIC